DQNAQRSTRSNTAREPLFLVAETTALWQGDRADGGRGGNRRTRSQREQGGSANIGMHQTARQPGQPGIERIIQTRRNARTHQQLTRQHEQGHGYQNEVGTGIPQLMADSTAEHGGGKEKVQQISQNKQR